MKYNELQNRIRQARQGEIPRGPQKPQTQSPPQPPKTPSNMNVPPNAPLQPTNQRQTPARSKVQLECVPSGKEGQLTCVPGKSNGRNGNGNGEGAGEQESLVGEDVWMNVARKYRNSVVQVLSESVAVNPFSPFLSAPSYQARGSGFFIREDGYFLTNAHVDLSALEVYVKRESESDRYLKCKILGLSPSKDTSLCRLTRKELLKLREPIVPVKWGDSDALESPSPIASLSYPLGISDLKITTGVFSGHERHEDALGADNAVRSYLQITNVIAQGSSGGPVFSSQGEVIGISSQGIKEQQGMNFAIPSKSVFSILRSLFAVHLYPDKIVPAPTLPFLWQSSNKHLLLSSNVDRGYKGGLYINKKTNLAIPPQNNDLQEGDIIVDIRCPNPYSKDKDYLNIDTYRPSSTGRHVAFPAYERESKGAPMRPPPATTPTADLSSPEALRLPCFVIQEKYETDQERLYLSGGVEWNIGPENRWPMLRVRFNRDDETIMVQEQENENAPWFPHKLYERRKMFFTDFLDILPSGITLTFTLYRNGKRVCVQRQFSPILPKYQGLRILFPPFQDYRNEYEILGGMCLMNLYLNHFRVCLPNLVKRLEGFLRYKPAVIVTHLFNLSPTSRSGVVDPLSVLCKLDLFLPLLPSSGRPSGVQQGPPGLQGPQGPQGSQPGEGRSLVLQYKSAELTMNRNIETVEHLRRAIREVVATGISYFRDVIRPNLDFFTKALQADILRAEIQTLRDARCSFEEIDQLLNEKYQSRPSEGQPMPRGEPGLGPRAKMCGNGGPILSDEERARQEEQLLAKYLTYIKPGNAWHHLLTLSLTFEQGNVVMVGFPEVFIEDAILNEKLMLRKTDFAKEMDATLMTELIGPMTELFPVPVHPLKRVDKKAIEQKLREMGIDIVAVKVVPESRKEPPEPLSTKS